MYAPIDYDAFQKQNWDTFYWDPVEHLPTNAPTPLGKPVEIRCYVDADHAGDKVTRKSCTGIIIFLNLAPIIWYSKKQNTVETSTFGSKFEAIKVATEILRGLWYKLRMMGIPIVGPSYVYCDNNSGPASTLKKKSNSIMYHVVQWSVTADKQRVTHISSENNVSDLMTKPLPGGAKRDSLVGRVLHDIVNEVTPMIGNTRDSFVLNNEVSPGIPDA
jgi:hypothetical protein